jgi:hypothetical protein
MNFRLIDYFINYVFLKVVMCRFAFQDQRVLVYTSPYTLRRIERKFLVSSNWPRPKKYKRDKSISPTLSGTNHC